MNAPTKLPNDGKLHKGDSITLTDLVRMPGTTFSGGVACSFILGQTISDDVSSVSISNCKASALGASGSIMPEQTFAGTGTTKPYLTANVATKSPGILKILLYPTGSVTADRSAIVVFSSNSIQIDLN